MKPCCLDQSNLSSTNPSPDLLIKTCQVCGARHFELTLDPGQLGTVGASVNG